MYIGEVAKRTGASPKAIRLYEILRLLPVIKRKGRYRNFTERDVGVIQIIKQAQRLGFRLVEIKALLDGEISCDIFPWEKAIVLVKQKIQNNGQEILNLKRKNNELIKLIKMLKKNKCS